ncbi:MAG: hypothetical protein ABH875_06695 [Candidatus Omnitrophota bacterium]
MPSPIGKEESVLPGQVSLLAPGQIKIPPVYGMIKEVFQQDVESKGLVVHVQDLHTHYQAHKNIAGIVQHIVTNYGINTILCEAKATDRGFAYLRPWVEKEAREIVAEENLKAGIFTGWEALDLASDLELVLQGVEDKELYMKDMDSFLKAEAFRKDALQFTDILSNICGNLKTHLYSNPQKAFDEKMARYRDEQIPIAEYAGYLTVLADKRGIAHDDLVNIGLVLENLDLEKMIDFKNAERQREEIVSMLSERLSEDQMKGLLEVSMKFKANRISQHEFYGHLKNYIRTAGIDIKSYGDLDLYIKYIASYHNLDASMLFEEINHLENGLADTLFKRDDQKKLFAISKNMAILKGLISFKLIPDEFDYYNKTKSDFDLKDWLAFLRLNAEHFKLATMVPDDASIIEENIGTLESFYEIAHKRDEAFAKNIETQFERRGIKAAMLMTGGFHTPGVTRRLKEAGYSYVVISPRIEEELDDERYYDILKESFNMLKETSAIGSWASAELESRRVALFNELIARKSVRFAETPTEVRMLDVMNRNGALLIDPATGARAAILRPALAQQPELLDRILFGVVPQVSLAILNDLKRQGGSRAQFPTRPEDRRMGSTGNDFTTEVYGRVEGVVEVYALDANGDVIPGSGRILAPEEGALVSTGDTEPEWLPRAPEASLDVQETILKDPVRTVLDASKVARIIADRDRDDVNAFIEERGYNAGILINADLLVGTSDPAKAEAFIAGHREELRGDLLSLASSMLEARKSAPDLIFYDFEGTDGIVALIKGIWEGLATVSENSQLMMYESDPRQKKRFAETRFVSISWAGAAQGTMANPTLFFETGVPTADGTGLNLYAWDSVINALLVAPASLAVKELFDQMGQDRSKVEARINEELSNEGSIYYKLAGIISRLIRVQRSEIGADKILALLYDYDEYREDASSYIDKIRGLDLFLKPIRPLNFEEIRTLYEAMGELIRSL